MRRGVRLLVSRVRGLGDGRGGGWSAAPGPGRPAAQGEGLDREAGNCIGPTSRRWPSATSTSSLRIEPSGRRGWCRWNCPGRGGTTRVPASRSMRAWKRLTTGLRARSWQLRSRPMKNLNSSSSIARPWPVPTRTTRRHANRRRGAGRSGRFGIRWRGLVRAPGRGTGTRTAPASAGAVAGKGREGTCGSSGRGRAGGSSGVWKRSEGLKRGRSGTVGGSDPAAGGLGDHPRPDRPPAAGRTGPLPRIAGHGLQRQRPRPERRIGPDALQGRPLVRVDLKEPLHIGQREDLDQLRADRADLQHASAGPAPLLHWSTIPRS